MFLGMPYEGWIAAVSFIAVVMILLSPGKGRRKNK